MHLILVSLCFNSSTSTKPKISGAYNFCILALNTIFLFLFNSSSIFFAASFLFSNFSSSLCDKIILSSNSKLTVKGDKFSLKAISILLAFLSSFHSFGLSI